MNGLPGPATTAAHQHKAAQGAERPELPHRRQGPRNRRQGHRNPGEPGHRPGNRLFAYDAYLAILSEGTEPL
jgi:hypothetical protein